MNILRIMFSFLLYKDNNVKFKVRDIEMLMIIAAENAYSKK